MHFHHVYLVSTDDLCACQTQYKASRRTGSLPDGSLGAVHLLQASTEAQGRALAQAFLAQCSVSISKHLSVVYRLSAFQEGFGVIIELTLPLYLPYVIDPTMPSTVLKECGSVCH